MVAQVQGNNLLQLINQNDMECLNEQADNNLSRAIITSDPEFELRSSDDEQLLIKLPFTSPVKISAIRIKVKDASIDAGTAPKTVKLFVNYPDIEFSDATDMEPSQTLDLTRKHVAGETIPLKFVKFQNVRHLSIFVESNQGDKEVTTIGHIALFGMPETNVDMANWKPVKNGGEEG